MSLSCHYFAVLLRTRDNIDQHTQKQFFRKIRKDDVDRHEETERACLTANELARTCLSPEWNSLFNLMKEDSVKETKKHFTAIRGCLFVGCLCLRSGRAGEPLLLTIGDVENGAPIKCQRTEEIYMYRYRLKLLSFSAKDSNFSVI